MTDEVTEIPRCCSRRIQSEVAWRAALRPFTVPAIWMAPPKSNSFSVSVVLPASGCEMIAHVRRRLISAVNSVMNRSSECVAGGAASAQGESQHRGILPAAHGLVIAAAHADLLEADVLIQSDRGRVGGTHLEECLAHPGGGAALEEIPQHAAAEPTAAVRIGDAKVEDVRLAGADDLIPERQHAADIAHPQAVAEDALAPGKLV